MTHPLATLLLLHGGDEHLDLIYFWSAVLIAILPVAVFIAIGVLVARGYWRRGEADGGGEPPARNPSRP